MGVVRFVDFLFSAYELILLLRVIFSWVQIRSNSPIVEWIYRLTEPVLRPVRSILPAYGGIDFSPVIVFLLLGLLEPVVLGLLRGLLVW